MKKSFLCGRMNVFELQGKTAKSLKFRKKIKLIKEELLNLKDDLWILSRLNIFSI